MQKIRDPDQTQQIILKAAFDEFHRNGFQGSSISNILKRTGLTKGALFYHFPNKLSLGYAVVDELIEPMIVAIWISPLDARTDPITALQDLLKNAIKRMSEQWGSKALLLGCPLHHLSEEMSGLDEGFKDRCNRIFRRWQSGVAGVLVDAKEQGLIDQHIDEENTAMFIIASIEGAISMGKRHQTIAGFLETLQGNNEHLSLYLNSLRV